MYCTIMPPNRGPNVGPRSGPRRYHPNTPLNNGQVRENETEDDERYTTLQLTLFHLDGTCH